MTIIESLLSLTNYPVSVKYVTQLLITEGINAQADFDSEVYKSAPYKRAMANFYNYLAVAPNVSQGGINFSFTTEDKNQFRRIASNLFVILGDTDKSVEFGYQGDSF